MKCSLTSLICSLTLLTLAKAAEPTPAPFAVTFANPPVPPARGVPNEARDAGTVPHSSSTNGRFEVQFREIPDTSDHGPLPTLLGGRISSIHVTYADRKPFPRNKEITTYLHRLVGTASGSSYTAVMWSQMLGQPFLAATVTHNDDTPGRLLLWYDKLKGYFVYQDGAQKWWFGTYSLDSKPTKRK